MTLVETRDLSSAGEFRKGGPTTVFTVPTRQESEGTASAAQQSPSTETENTWPPPATSYPSVQEITHPHGINPVWVPKR